MKRGRLESSFFLPKRPWGRVTGCSVWGQAAGNGDESVFKSLAGWLVGLVRCQGLAWSQLNRGPPPWNAGTRRILPISLLCRVMHAGPDAWNACSLWLSDLPTRGRTWRAWTHTRAHTHAADSQAPERFQTLSICGRAPVLPEDSKEFTIHLSRGHFLGICPVPVPGQG